MITREEVLFVERFVSALSFLNVTKVPFADHQFKTGVDCLANFVTQRLDSYKSFRPILKVFLKRPVSGNYDRMIEAFQHLNGSRVNFALQNPTWERAEISIPPLFAKRILEEFEDQVPKEVMIEAAREFCLGANIPVT